jgi:PAS domain S-box-containing protein
MESPAAKILIVDDEPRNLDALEAMLEVTGCTCVRAGSADEALLALLQHEFAAMVLDIRMPGMSGIELASLIKQRRRTQDVPILFLTAHLVDDADVLRGYGAGAVDYLSKPVNPDILRSKIAVFIELYQKTRALARVNAALENEVAERQRAQEALQQANDELELRVRERTAQLLVAHRGVRENEERLRLAIDVSRMAAWEWNVETNQMTWSSDPEALFGFPPGAFGIQKRLFAALHPEDRPRIEGALRAATESGTYEGDYRIVRPDGSIVWITERGRAIKRDDDSIEKMVGVSRDVTAEREAAQERERLLVSERRARDEAERQSRLKDDFLATLSHELRTPMNVILGWLDILRSGKPIRELDAALELIARNAQLQAKLIDDLLDMNRLTSGSFQLEIASVDVAATLQSTMQGLRPAADAKQIQLLLTVDTRPVQIVADGRRLQQILWNLLHNAIKFTPAGGRVDTSIQRADGEIHVAIRDTGRGISREFLPHVFERFSQENSSYTREFFGLGLGLSITKHLVEAHGGIVEAHSDGPNCGATFTVRLPIACGIAADQPSDVALVDSTSAPSFSA